MKITKSFLVLGLFSAISLAATRKPIAEWPQSGKDEVVALSAHGAIVALSYVTQINGATNTIQLYQNLGAWQQIASLTISNSRAYVTSLALTNDYLLVGTLFSWEGYGAAYVFVKPPNGWTNASETATLLPSDPTSESSYGYSVSAYGPTAVVGAPTAGQGRSGAAYVFQQPANGWQNATENAKLTASDAATGYDLGYSVAVVGVPGSDGSEISVGSPNADEPNQYQGAVYVFDEPSEGWVDMIETAKLTDAAGKGGYNIGWSVAMSYNIVVAGAPRAQDDANHTGVVLAYVKPNSGWVDTGKPDAQLLDPTAATLGWSVGIVQSGTQIVACCGRSLKRGEQDLAFLFTQPKTGWRSETTASSKLKLPEPGNEAWNVAITSGVAAIGTISSSDPPSAGTYIFAAH